MENTQSTFFDMGFALSALRREDDPLLKIEQFIDFKQFVEVVTPIWRPNVVKDPRGRKPWSVEIMFRLIMLKYLYNMSDEDTETQIYNNISFRCFVGLDLLDTVPDSRTIWLYNEALAKNDAARKLFDAFKTQLSKNGLLIKEGQIVDSTFTLVPKQRNTREENETIKNGEVPKEWEKKPRKLSQKDIGARWTKKNKESFYGYKDHIKTGERTKLINKFTVTDASAHDSQELVNLLEKNDIRLHADSAYSGAPIAEHLEQIKVENHIHEKGARKHPLTEEQKESNRKKSVIRVRVEHVFGFMTNSLGKAGILNRCIGLVRNKFAIGMRNFLYNVHRCIQLLKMPQEKLKEILTPTVMAGKLRPHV
jgi:IS5 family transposase